MFGPPLLGRAALARGLERHLPSSVRVRAAVGDIPIARIREALDRDSISIVEGTFATVSERIALREAAERIGAEVLFIAWLCDPNEAKREIYRRYATLPARFADEWWSAWQEDWGAREPLGDEIPIGALVGIDARRSMQDHFVRVAAALGLSEARATMRVAPKRVLLVDDDDDLRELLGEALRMLGCRVWQAGSAEEALRIVESEVLDLVITDQQMPGASGTDLAADLAVRRPEVRIALLTGYAAESVDAAVRTPGIDLLLAKPVSGVDLVRLLDEIGDE